MLRTIDITNTIFTSKTYILSKVGEEKAWLVDIGDIDPVLSYLKEHQLIVSGVFITHGHFDHIYGLKSLIEHYADCKVYVTEYGKEALASDKLNMSRYHETPFVYEGDNIVVVHEGEEKELFKGESPMCFYEIPGHNPGCLTMVLGGLIFTGDAYIPGVKVVTNLPGGSKRQAQESVETIMELAKGRIICPGHGSVSKEYLL